jgi:hypothetical protein
VIYSSGESLVGGRKAELSLRLSSALAHWRQERMVDQKECFVVMPISNPDGYGEGHCNRVYEFLIKPACEKAGFEPLRADEVSKTNHIVIDILRHLHNAEMVLCDLSSKNPNVLYELGIRQAFNKPVVLIKDDLTDRIFDIQGFRYCEYDSALRVDSVQTAIPRIAKAIEETGNSHQDDVNSLIQLLGVVPAALPQIKHLSDEGTLILRAIEDLGVRLTSAEDMGKQRKAETRRDDESLHIVKLIEKLWLLNTHEAEDEIKMLEKRLRQMVDTGRHPEACKTDLADEKNE